MATAISNAKFMELYEKDLLFDVIPNVKISGENRTYAKTTEGRGDLPRLVVYTVMP